MSHTAMLYSFTIVPQRCNIVSFTGAINDIAFPTDYSQLFATCGHEDIRIWNSHTCTELLRIQVPGLTCLTVAFAVDGKSILSG